MGIGETITVINKSGKVVSSSKHIVGVWKEARAAYRERKAEIQADREAAVLQRKLTDGVRTLRIEDDVQSRASSHRSKHSKATHRSKSHRHSHGPDRPPLERGYSDSFYANDPPPYRYEQDLAGEQVPRRELMRRSTDMAVSRSKRRDSIDMDLAYGDVPPPLPEGKRVNEGELKEKASKVTMLLDEANCLQHTVTATIENLQKNPEALAAVSLTLAEISTLVGKMGPGVLIALKTSFPAVAALLLSPQFMIAGGVAVGVTIVALGGYKIIKKIQAQKEVDGPIPMAAMPARAATVDEHNELDELEPQELSRVEMWRRGIADVEARSVGTDVDGEFITPGASKQLVDAGVLDADDLKSRRSTKTRKDSGEPRPKVHRARSEKSVKSTHSTGTRRSKTVKESSSSSKKKEKEPSGIRMIFRSHTTQL